MADQYTPQKSGIDAIKTIIQNEPKIHLYENDPRNNRKFRTAHPNVVFDLIAPISIITPNTVNTVKKHRHEINTKNIIDVNGQKLPEPGRPPLSSMDKELKKRKLFGRNPVDNKFLKYHEDSKHFLFHEMVNESYDIAMDDEHESGADHQPVQIVSGADHTEENTSLTPPVNLVASVQSTDLAQSPQGGQPTWETTLNFDVDGLADDYEIRIIKVS